MKNLRQRIERAFRFEEVRPVPYTVWYDRNTEQRLDRHFGGADWKDRIENCVERSVIVFEPADYLEPGVYRDIHGTVWKQGNPVHIVKPALAEPELRGYSIPDYTVHLKNNAGERIDYSHGVVPAFGYDQFAARFAGADGGGPLRIVGYGPGVFERGWMIRGFEDFMADLASEPRFAEELLDQVTHRQVELLEALCRLPVDGILFADDWGDQRDVTIGPELWRRLIKPRVARLYDAVHAAGKLAFQHSCGNVLAIVPDLIEIGLDCLQSLQPEAMPVYELKKRYGRDLLLWGGLGTQELLPFGTPEAIRKEARRLKKELGRGGGYIFSSSKPIMSDVPIENAVAMIEESIEAKGEL